MKTTYAKSFLVRLAMLRRFPPTEASLFRGVERKKPRSGAGSIKTRLLLGLIMFGIAAYALVLDLRVRAQSSDPQALQTAPGQFVTPLAVPGAVQQYLNPGLPAYPDFVAGEAVRSQLSPDGKTLAILCAGQNSLYKPDGTVDVANSTQYIFLYNVVGANKANPALTQVIKQVNAHVGLVF